MRYPLYIIPTLSATKKTFKISSSQFKEHQLSTKGNAFRHALWNALICSKVNKIVKNKQKSVFFAQKVTDLYEKVTRNEILDETMDLHNNAIGRLVFFDNLNENEAVLTEKLMKKVEIAQKIVKMEDFPKNSTRLIYTLDG